MNPDKWGPHLWKSIHYIALGYPQNPDDIIKQSYKNFYINLWRYIPCYKCSKNYKNHLKEIDIDLFLNSTEKLFEWTVLLHNIVNRDLGKKQLSLKDAYTLYFIDNSNTDHIHYTSSKNDKWMYVSILFFIVILILVFRLNFRSIRT